MALGSIQFIQVTKKRTDLPFFNFSAIRVRKKVMWIIALLKVFNRWVWVKFTVVLFEILFLSLINYYALSLNFFIYKKFGLLNTPHVKIGVSYLLIFIVPSTSLLLLKLVIYLFQTSFLVLKSVLLWQIEINFIKRFHIIITFDAILKSYTNVFYFF